MPNKTNKAKMSKKTTPTETLKTNTAVINSHNDTSLVISGDDMSALLQILLFSKQLYVQMAKDSNTPEVKDPKAAEMYTARAQISVMLYNKLRAAYDIGEPESRDYH